MTTARKKYHPLRSFLVTFGRHDITFSETIVRRIGPTISFRGSRFERDESVRIGEAVREARPEASPTMRFTTEVRA